MLKKMTAFLLSLLLCLSLLPGRALASEIPDSPAPVVVEEPKDPENPAPPEDPENPVMPLGLGGNGNVPDDGKAPHP